MSPQNRPLHVLVLDDDEKILRLLKIFMRQMGYRVTTAQNGREGIRKLLRSHFDLIIVDVQMPIVDGFTFAKEVLRLWPWEKIILCTGFLDSDVTSQAKSLGIEAILEKPISFNTLEDCIQQVFVPDVTEHGSAISTSVANDVNGCELSYLREFTDNVMQHHTLGKTIADFASVIMKTVPSVAAGVFGLQGEYGRFSISSLHPLDEKFVESISNKITTHLEFFSGEPLPCVPNPELSVQHNKRSPVMEADHQVLMTPVAGGRDAVGIIFLVIPKQETTQPVQTSSLRICAHHLSTVIECLEYTSSERMNDPLTGLFSWNYVENQISTAWKTSEPNQQTLGWIDIDLSEFKSVNETYGFYTGDTILQDVAKVVESHLQGDEIAGRRAADEFCILLKHATPERIKELAKLILEGIHHFKPLVDLGGEPIQCCIGTATTINNSQITSASQLIECAEHARFEAEKKEGGTILSWSDLQSSGKASITLHPILVVDDDPQIIVLIKRILNKQMYEVTGAETVAEAMSLLEKGNRYEVMLTDLSLPYQDGIEMIRLGKSVDPDMIPVVVSGNISKDSEGKLIERGAHEIIRKPFEPGYLRQVVQNASEIYTRNLKKAK